MFGRKTVNYVGPKDQDLEPLFPVGLCKVITEDYLTVAFVRDNAAQDVFCLDPGVHRVRTPEGVRVHTSCSKQNKWSVVWPGRFDNADPTRIEVGLVRPRSPLQEQQDYMNEIMARTSARETAELLRSGRAEFDPSQEDYDFEQDGEDMEAPFSTHQMQLIVEQLQRDMARQVKQKAAPAADQAAQAQPDKADQAKPGKAASVPKKSGKDIAADQGDED